MSTTRKKILIVWNIARRSSFQITYLLIQIKLMKNRNQIKYIHVYTIMKVTWQYLSGPVTNHDFQSDHLKLLSYRQLQYLRSSLSSHHHIQPMPRIKDDYKLEGVLITKSRYALL